MRPIQIKGCEHYSVDAFGVVMNTETGRVLRPDLTIHGYRRVTLWSKEQKAVRMFSHRLVAMHYIDNPDNKPMVNHIDGNKLNNHKSNLEWVTCKENTIHAFKTGLRVAPDQRGRKAFNRSLSEDQVIRIRELKALGWKRADIVKEVGCSIWAYKNTSRYYKN